MSRYLVIKDTQQQVQVNSIHQDKTGAYHIITELVPPKAEELFGLIRTSQGMMLKPGDLGAQWVETWEE